MVKIYIADTTPLADELLYRKLYDSLDVDRRSKADHFLFPKDKRLCVAAGTLLRATLREEHISEYTLARHPNGKPYLAENERLCFNLSHSGQMVMCALSDSEVGCDVEQKGPFDPALAAHVMTQQDLQRIYQEEAGNRADIFFRLWTLKESYMKATGMGILLEPGSFGISFHGGSIRAVPCVDRRKFYFKEYIRNDGYCYSCCCQSDTFPDSLTQVEINTLL